MKTLEHYKGIVGSRGKFEGENPITPYLFEKSMEGDGETISFMEDGDGVFAVKFDLYAHELEQFDADGNLPCSLIMVEDSQGFVYSMSEEKFNNWIN